MWNPCKNILDTQLMIVHELFATSCVRMQPCTNTIIYAQLHQWRIYPTKGGCTINLVHFYNWSFIQVKSAFNNSLVFTIHTYNISSITCTIHLTT